MRRLSYPVNTLWLTPGNTLEANHLRPAALEVVPAYDTTQEIAFSKMHLTFYFATEQTINSIIYYELYLLKTLLSTLLQQQPRPGKHKHTSQNPKTSTLVKKHSRPTAINTNPKTGTVTREGGLGGCKGRGGSRVHGQEGSPMVHSCACVKFENHNKKKIK